MASSLPFRDRIILRLLGAVPNRLASHVMFLLNTHPATADEWRYHVRPIHYYEPLPDFSRLDPAATRRRRVSTGIHFDVDEQLKQARQLSAAFGQELADTGFDFANEYFSGLDAAMYYSIIRRVRPSRVIEIGAGMSTRIAAAALARNRAEQHPGELTCIEPFPQPRLTHDMPAVTLIQRPVEDVPLDTFDALRDGDILFIDSSHAVRFGGDVCREFLEILPRLKAGVWIHVHDVFFPYDYPAEWLIERRLAFNEQYLLEAFLAFNHDFQSQLCLHWLWLEHCADLSRGWPETVLHGARRHAPSSFWMRRVA